MYGAVKMPLLIVYVLSHCVIDLSLSNKPNYVILNNASAYAARGVTNNDCLCFVFNIVHTHSCTTLIAVFISNNFKKFVSF